ncbi:MAG: xanthine dehydrogenase family protein subunit M [Geminicoccaceae bacterium]
MIPGNFAYHRPADVAAAARLLREHGDEAQILAGGHSLIPMMKLRMAMPSHLIDLQDVAGLKGIGRDGDRLVIGAMTTQHELIGDPLVADAAPLLRAAALQIADPQVRYVGTIGGNVANGDPGNDMPGVMQCLDAAFELTGPGGTREVAARAFSEAAFTTARAEDEILTRIIVPVPRAGSGYAYLKQKRKIGDYATAAAAVLLSLGNGSCTSAAIAMTNLAATPIFSAAAGAALVGTTLDDTAIGAAVAAMLAAIDPATDNRGPIEFKRHVAQLMLRRAIAEAAGRADRGIA